MRRRRRMTTTRAAFLYGWRDGSSGRAADPPRDTTRCIVAAYHRGRMAGQAAWLRAEREAEDFTCH